jgi:hypothetical protein
MENRNGLIVGAVATRASRQAKRLAARHLIEAHADRPQKVTLALAAYNLVRLRKVLVAAA